MNKGYQEALLISSVNAVHKEKSNKMQQCINILLFRIYMKLNMFRATTAHHQEHKTALAASGLSYVECC
jgi:hypothetical protein